MRNLLLWSSILAAIAEIKFPSDFPQDVRNIMEALVPGEVTLELHPDATFPSAEGFEVSCAANTTSLRSRDRRGLIVAFYSLLRRLGFGFLHPLQVIVPTHDLDWCITFADGPGDNGRRGTPMLGAVRGSHYHTQHPLELTNLLNGFSQDGSFDSEVSWSSGLPAWSMYLQWLAANGQNFVEWCLLEAKQFQNFSTSPARQSRLKKLVEMAHDWGLLVSIDAPFNLAQQHAWRLQPSAHADVSQRLEWLIEVGIDAISTEVGTTEFTSTSASATLDLINSVVDKLASHGMELIVKNHASTAQRAKGFKDPLQPNQDINFNFITYYADERVVSAPHTVQMYALKDPLMGSYGRHDYSDVEGMMSLMQKEGKPFVFFPETAYWVDFDTSVPLFLPIYGADRLMDLQQLRREMPDSGHLNFESGWPFGSWLNNAVQAAAAWSSDCCFEGALAQLLKPLPDASALVRIVTALADIQNRTLVYDIFLSQDGNQQTLMAYLQGDDGMNEAQDDWNFAVVAPRRTPPRDLDPAWFKDSLEPRITALTNFTTPLAAECAEIRGRLAARKDAAQKLTVDLCIGVEIFALRVKQVHGVYRAAAAAAGNFELAWHEGLAQSQRSIAAAMKLIGEGELDADTTRWTGVSSPTAYPFGYLWAASTLFFWRRDHQIVLHSIKDPCYLNLYDPIEVGLAEGGSSLFKLFSKYGRAAFERFPWLRKWAGCMTGPRTEPPSLDPIDVNLSSLREGRSIDFSGVDLFV